MGRSARSGGGTTAAAFPIIMGVCVGGGGLYIVPTLPCGRTPACTAFVSTAPSAVRRAVRLIRKISLHYGIHTIPWFFCIQSGESAAVPATFTTSATKRRTEQRLEPRLPRSTTREWSEWREGIEPRQTGKSQQSGRYCKSLHKSRGLERVLSIANLEIAIPLDGFPPP